METTHEIHRKAINGLNKARAGVYRAIDQQSPPASKPMGKGYFTVPNGLLGPNNKLSNEWKAEGTL